MTLLRTRATGAAIAAFACLFAVGAAPAFADSPSRTITVTGHGEAAGTPDMASISAGVQIQAKTAAQALAENADAMNSVFAALKRLGVPNKDVQTSDFSVSPQYVTYSSNTGQGQRLVGYQVSNQVNVTLDDTAKVGPAIDALVAAGANQMNSISFSIRDPKALQDDARTAAVDDAIARAQVLTKAAHVTLGPITSIEESSTEQTIERPMLAGMLKAPQPTPIAAGSQTISADVSITWEIQ